MDGLLYILVAYFWRSVHWYDDRCIIVFLLRYLGVRGISIRFDFESQDQASASYVQGKTTLPRRVVCSPKKSRLRVDMFEGAHAFASSRKKHIFEATSSQIWEFSPPRQLPKCRHRWQLRLMRD